jgi:predicted nucleic acid-binding protein
MRTVYLETTIVSYYAARPSRDVVTLARQQVTREWWENRRGALRNLISPAVLEEAQAGDRDAALRRLKALQGVEVLQYEPAVDPLAERLRRALGIPRRKGADALHLAYVVHYEIEILLTWNCEHLADAETQMRMADLARLEGLWLPVICTPEQMGA